MTWLVNNFSQVQTYFIGHLLLTLIVVAIAGLLGVVLGLLLSTTERYPRSWTMPWLQNGVREGLLTLSAAALTIPSVALFFALLVVFGLGFVPTVVGLVIYALYPVLRNTVAGLNSVDPGVMESARGMGFTTTQRLVRVQLPLAWPVILSGLRVSVLITISIAVVAAYVQGPGLGTLVQTGLSRFGSAGALPQVVWGTIGCLVVAIVFEIFFTVVKRSTTPRGLRV